MQPGHRPLLVVSGPLDAFHELVGELRAGGWDVVQDWAVAGGVTAAGIVCAGFVATREHATAAVLAAAAGAGVVAHMQCDVDVTAALVEDLEQLGPVTYHEAPARQLSDDQRTALRLLGEGLTLAEAAERLFVSRRTVARRIAEARAILGTSSTVRAVQLAEELEPPEPPQQDDPPVRP